MSPNCANGKPYSKGSQSNLFGKREVLRNWESARGLGRSQYTRLNGHRDRSFFGTHASGVQHAGRARTDRAVNFVRAVFVR